MKVKNFMPPYAAYPEVYLKEGRFVRYDSGLDTKGTSDSNPEEEDSEEQLSKKLGVIHRPKRRKMNTGIVVEKATASPMNSDGPEHDLDREREGEEETSADDASTTEKSDGVLPNVIEVETQSEVESDVTRENEAKETSEPEESPEVKPEEGVDTAVEETTPEESTIPEQTEDNPVNEEEPSEEVQDEDSKPAEETLVEVDVHEQPEEETNAGPQEEEGEQEKEADVGETEENPVEEAATSETADSTLEQENNEEESDTNETVIMDELGDTNVAEEQATEVAEESVEQNQEAVDGLTEEENTVEANEIEQSELEPTEESIAVEDDESANEIITDNAEVEESAENVDGEGSAENIVVEETPVQAEDVEQVESVNEENSTVGGDYQLTEQNVDESEVNESEVNIPEEKAIEVTNVGNAAEYDEGPPVENVEDVPQANIDEEPTENRDDGETAEESAENAVVEETEKDEEATEALVEENREAEESVVQENETGEELEPENVVTEEAEVDVEANGVVSPEELEETTEPVEQSGEHEVQEISEGPGETVDEEPAAVELNELQANGVEEPEPTESDEQQVEPEISDVVGESMDQSEEVAEGAEEETAALIEEDKPDDVAIADIEEKEMNDHGVLTSALVEDENHSNPSEEDVKPSKKRAKFDNRTMSRSQSIGLAKMSVKNRRGKWNSLEDMSKIMDEMDIHRLREMLMRQRTERKILENKREEMVRRIRYLHSKASTSKEQAREQWRRRFVETKKLTPRLEEECTRLRQELEKLLRDLLLRLEEDVPTTGQRTEMLMPSDKMSNKLMVLRTVQEIEDVRRRVEGTKIRLAAEARLREQAENDVKALREELMNKKIQVTLTRKDVRSAVHFPV